MEKNKNIIRTRRIDDVLYQVMDDGELRPIKSKTDQKKLRAMSEQKIEKAAMSDPDAQPLGEEFWADAEITRPGRSPVYMNLDSDVVAWFRAKGRGYQAHMNAVLRHYMNAQSK